MKKICLIISITFLFNGCTPAFQPFQSKIDKSTSNMTDAEKQELLNSFIKKNTGTAIYKNYNVKNSCLEYNYKNKASDSQYKYSYVVQDNKKDESLCKTLNTNTGKWWDHDKCSSILKEQNEFHEYVQQVEKKISTDFDPMKMKNDIFKIKNYIANGDKAFNDNDIEASSLYYKEACYIEQALENYEYSACKKQRDIADRKEREREGQQELVRAKQWQYMRQLVEPLRNRKGQHIMTFFETCSYRAYGYKDLGGRYQYVSVFGDNVYDNLQEALNDGWKFKSKAKESKEQINEYCVCEGNSYVLEK